MAEFYGEFIIEWKCLKPEVYNETHGFITMVGQSEHDVKEKFLKHNTDYIIISITLKE